MNPELPGFHPETPQPQEKPEAENNPGMSRREMMRNTALLLGAVASKELAFFGADKLDRAESPELSHEEYEQAVLQGEQLLLPEIQKTLSKYNEGEFKQMRVENGRYVFNGAYKEVRENIARTLKRFWDRKQETQSVLKEEIGVPSQSATDTLNKAMGRSLFGSLIGLAAAEGIQRVAQRVKKSPPQMDRRKFFAVLASGLAAGSAFVDPKTRKIDTVISDPNYIRDAQENAPPPDPEAEIESAAYLATRAIADRLDEPQWKTAEQQNPESTISWKLLMATLSLKNKELENALPASTTVEKYGILQSQFLDLYRFLPQPTQDASISTETRRR